MANKLEDEKTAIRASAFAAALILFIVFLILIFMDADKAKYITVSVMFVFAVLATRLDDITDLNFGATGLATKLERQLREAQATVKQLQSVAEVFSQISIQQIQSSNRMGGLPPKAKRLSIEKIVEGLRTIDLSEDRIAKVLESGKAWDDFDYHAWTMYGVNHDGKIEVIEARNTFYAKYPQKGLGTNPSAEIVEEFLNAHGWNKGETGERLLDWKHFMQTGSHRRLDKWEARHSDPVVGIDELTK